MKVRTDYVTNSSSSSYIICFARISDYDKAKKIIDEFDLDIYDVKGVNGEKNWCGELGAEFCGAIIYGVDSILENYPNDNFVIIRDGNDAYYDEYGDPVYDYDFSMDDAINNITKENGFDNIKIAEGEGRDG